MPLTKDQKQEVVSEIAGLLNNSKIIVMAKYTGTGVKDLQTLRREAKENGTVLKIVKNRLVKQALKSNDRLKDVDNSILVGQLIYGFNPEDEVAPAQVLASFAKSHPGMEFVGAITEDAKVLLSEDVKALAALPSKQELRAQLVGTLSAPTASFVNILAGNLRSVLNVLSAHAESIS